MSVDLEAASVLAPSEQEGFVWLRRDQCAEQGKLLAHQYRSAEPFPHAVLTNFLPKAILRRVLDEFPKHEPGRFSDAQSKLKTGYQLEKITSPYVNSLINALNSAAFLTFLEEMTGIEGLVSDPYQVGGGLHETLHGGHLSIHADFNMHSILKLKRRLNLILFLNEDWEADFGGYLELWSKDMSKCCEKVSPDIGTAVIFNTDSDSFHGHPDPLNCPSDRTRRSLALYYYTADTSFDSDQFSLTTDFQVRPNSADRINVKNKTIKVLKSITPPLIYNLFK